MSTMAAVASRPRRPANSSKSGALGNLRFARAALENRLLTRVDVDFGHHRRKTSLTQIVSQISATTVVVVKSVTNSGKRWRFIIKGQPKSIIIFLAEKGTLKGFGHVERLNESTRRLMKGICGA
ncbi:hypothetical protein EVAR_22753_1 [Eumeta japonica]|uniref:Uncharacterized protein n=1 Tax=Eumeta variegata TaxID=151549 RepID=A0A4C1USD5_EUMVA|nr:hypothetical protein EVAR_22753_1 [Eumeta japonica]